MIDLNSPALQASFKRMKRVSLVARIIMGVLTLLSGTLAIWMAAKSRHIHMDWSEIVFIVLLIVASLCFIGLFVWTIFTNKPYSEAMHAFVAEGFYENAEFLSAIDRIICADMSPEFTIMLVGDKLTAFLKGTERVVQFDLTPVKNYPSVCGGTFSLVKKFLLCYSGVSALNKSVDRVFITNSVNVIPKTREYRVREEGKLTTALKASLFIRRGLIK